MRETLRDILVLIGFAIIMSIAIAVISVVDGCAAPVPAVRTEYRTRVERVKILDRCVDTPPPDEPVRDCDSIGIIECDDIMTARYADAYRGLKLWVDAYVWPACRDLR